MLFKPTDRTDEEARRADMFAACRITDRRPTTEADIRSAMRTHHTGRAWRI